MVHRHSHSSIIRRLSAAALGIAALCVGVAANAQPASGPTSGPASRPASMPEGHSPMNEQMREHHDQMMQFHGISKAIAVLHGTKGSEVTGTVTFHQTGSSVKVVAEVDGLEPKSTHAIHVHEYGDCSAPDGTSAGSHYNPENTQHGLPGSAPRHAGDLGNLTADEKGHAHYELTVDNISISGMLNPVIGRAVIVHAAKDDGGQPVGNAGPRIACGVIGVARDAAE